MEVYFIHHIFNNMCITIIMLTNQHSYSNRGKKFFIYMFYYVIHYHTLYNNVVFGIGCEKQRMDLTDKSLANKHILDNNLQSHKKITFLNLNYKNKNI